MKILYICTHNRCRSILSEALTNHLAGPNIIAKSAGSQPSGEVHPLSLRYLIESEIPTDGLQSQSWDEFENFKPSSPYSPGLFSTHSTSAVFLAFIHE